MARLCDCGSMVASGSGEVAEGGHGLPSKVGPADSSQMHVNRRSLRPDVVSKRCLWRSNMAVAVARFGLPAHKSMASSHREPSVRL
jgi:hypothetical protein